MTEKVFNVEGMSCGHCVNAVKTAAKSIEGVESCEVDLEQGTAKVIFADDTIAGDIAEAIEDEGFEVS